MPPGERRPPPIFNRPILMGRLMGRLAENPAPQWPSLRAMAKATREAASPRQLSTSPRRVLDDLQPRIAPRESDEGPSLEGESMPSPQVRPMWPSPLVLHPLAGVPLESPLRSGIERLMGSDLGHVRLHTDSTAASWAFRLRAHAFTVGRHIFFAAGRFQPQTRAGLELLVHELAHVRQQPGGAPLPWGQGTLTQYRTMEEEAHAQMQAVLAGVSPTAARGSQWELYTLNRWAAGSTEPVGGQTGLPIHTVQFRGGSDGFPPLILSYASRSSAVVPMRQESTISTAEGPPPSAGMVPGAAPASPAPEAPDPEQLAQHVYEWIQRRLRIEGERRGVQQWH
jgi:hypothetical protein